MSEQNEQQKRIDELYDLVEGIETAMFVTQRDDGQLVSRPMATQKRNPVADLWFVTDIESNKIDELDEHPLINLSYFSTKSYEWVSVSGSATISTDRAKIRELYQPDWKMWFGELDDVRNGGPDDPRLALILVNAESVIYMKREKSKPEILFELIKGRITGERPELGSVKSVSL
ncbi:pyridoxamine 5'-phosphate oxidase family protein [Gemmatimonas groenlandica]|uniref:Pyridoxamine 5'-phosphate oxidase family protein n=1 Tax=Gemmatimonas groenlandica TaxID=2732249 RepID=A0A6M4ISF8_9BACT|nr:pyridoxamine 5'-phosphate oxidase family protein [Gemmatimonas groenlandica]QJR35752.1 pyridoxamine 5'-phosphate oxidase family protein [Gemmatimonas groenlandica]